MDLGTGVRDGGARAGPREGVLRGGTLRLDFRAAVTAEPNAVDGRHGLGAALNGGEGTRPGLPELCVLTLSFVLQRGCLCSGIPATGDPSPRGQPHAAGRAPQEPPPHRPPRSPSSGQRCARARCCPRPWPGPGAQATGDAPGSEHGADSVSPRTHPAGPPGSQVTSLALPGGWHGSPITSHSSASGGGLGCCVGFAPSPPSRPCWGCGRVPVSVPAESPAPRPKAPAQREV